ncbi:nitrogenase-associated protein [Nodosilinea sp. LEGE 07298]|jgi:nitrogenase-associated protein|uniref:ArsC/Spx/MgsR family protein n=1 Tax=Nodosilinea sp. LEGE 07298 TaxID=2777970 RepID=UPI00187E6CF9|nr:ArsC/Spx/MgsR family protein [Nodosilinea sp. LEGE 07298]MBE9113204.1 nitrogenase-associated protein [Nodosilinea sp. LEGE 07298]
MVTVNFYEKPGCTNNTRQKALLQASGHQVIAHNLLLEPWTPELLHLFFGELPVAQWFNTTARAITTGLVVPEQLDAEIALDLMVLDPHLIRRPLLQVGDQRQVGFDPDAISRWIGLGATVLGETGISPTDLTLCPKATARLFAAGGASLAQQPCATF